MPPRKQPKSLQDLSLKSVARLATELCGNIDREHGRRKCQARRDKLVIGKTYLSPIQPLFDDLLKVLLDKNFKLDHSEMVPQDPEFVKADDKSLILELLICDRVTTVDLSQLNPSDRCLSNTPSFWKKLFLKLKNVVNLNIVGVRLTDASFRAIGEVCTNLKKLHITSEPTYAFMESMKHILKCRELRELEIEVRVGEIVDRIGGSEVDEYVGKLVVDLPKLEYIGAWIAWDRHVSATKPLTSMRKLLMNPLCVDLKTMTRVCPNVSELEIWFDDHCPSTPGRSTCKRIKQDKVLKVLAKSSLQLTSLKLDELAFSKDLTRVITCKGAHLTSLEINVSVSERITAKDVYTIGLRCAGIVELRLNFADKCQPTHLYGTNWPTTEEQTFDATPSMFVRLKVLELYSMFDWDQRIVPLILHHAVNLTRVKLIDVFEPSVTSVGPLSKILDASALQQLERLHVEAVSYNGRGYTIPFPKASIERLLGCCHKLVNLYLKGPMINETIEYLKAQPSYMKRENYDFTLEFIPVYYTLHTNP